MDSVTDKSSLSLDKMLPPEFHCVEMALAVDLWMTKADKACPPICCLAECKSEAAKIRASSCLFAVVTA